MDIDPLEQKRRELAQAEQLLEDLREKQEQALKKETATPENNQHTIKHAPEVLDGKEAKDLLESMRVFELESGDVVYAGTDKGINYGSHDNEDRVAISPANNLIVDIDGMGGMGHGELAAEILAEEFLTSPADTNLAVEKAREKMAAQNVGQGGAVFISARIITKEQPDKSVHKFLEVSQLGDAKLIIIKKDGTVDFESKDQSYVQTLVDLEQITEDEALYHDKRHVAGEAVTPEGKKVEPKSDQIKVEDGDLVLLYSDGISDNFTPGEIAKKKKKLNLSAEGLFAWLSEETGKRMRDYKKIIASASKEPDDAYYRKKDGVYYDGYKSKPKPDNRSLAIIEIKTTPVAKPEAVTPEIIGELEALNHVLGVINSHEKVEESNPEGWTNEEESELGMLEITISALDTEIAKNNSKLEKLKKKSGVEPEIAKIEHSTEAMVKERDETKKSLAFLLAKKERLSNTVSIPTTSAESVPLEAPATRSEDSSEQTIPLDEIVVGRKISYQGAGSKERVDYTVSEAPNEGNKYKYKLVHPRGKPIYKLTPEQLATEIRERRASLVPLEPASEPAPIARPEVIKNPEPIVPEPLNAADFFSEPPPLPVLPEIPPGESVEDEKARALATLMEVIERNRIIIENTDTAIDAAQKELAAIEEEELAEKARAAQASSGTEETSADITEQMGGLQFDINELDRGLTIKEEELKISLWRPFKYGRIKKELDTLSALLDQKRAKHAELSEKRRQAYEREFQAREKERAEERERKESERVRVEEEKKQERLKAIEEDKKINPFKYFQIEQMDDKVVRLLFGKDREDVSKEDVNTQMGETGKEIKILKFDRIGQWTFNAIHISSNGFSLLLENKDEVMIDEVDKNGDKKSVVGIYSPNARYMLVAPDWKYIQKGLNYTDGMTLLKKEAVKEQDYQFSLFEGQNGEK